MASVFHNRRWDGDFLTLRRLVSEGALGEVLRFESRFERWRPEVDPDRWREGGGPADAGGVLFDLGPHLIDQALELLGPARSVYAEVRPLRPGAQVDDDFFVALEHESGARSHLWANDAGRPARAAAAGARHERRVREVGTRRAGGRAARRARARATRASARTRARPGACWAARTTREPVETERGRYVEFYERMERRSARGASRRRSRSTAGVADAPRDRGGAGGAPRERVVVPL